MTLVDSYTKGKKLSPGMITPALLVITGAFLVVIYAILYVVSLQFDFSNRQVGAEQALHVAEAGVNYYRWHLAHDQTDFSGDTGEHEYTDPQGNAIGKFDLSVTAPSAGSAVVTIESTGWTYQYPNVKRTIKVQYGKSSYAAYSFLQNESSWYGNGITVNGPIHSNNGIRQDGTNLSLVTSAQTTYICGGETGCTNQSDCQNSVPEKDYCTWNSSQNRCECSGVWGEGADQGLWQYPETSIQFDSITFDFKNMRDEAKASGLYLGDSTRQGYHIIFYSNGTFRVYRVNSTSSHYHALSGYCYRIYDEVNNQSLIGTYNVVDRPIIFAEDHLWVEGVVKGRVSIVAAREPFSSSEMNIWIPNSLTQETLDENNSIGLIAQSDIYYTRDIPQNFQIDAALMAKSGKIIRHNYHDGCPNNSYTDAVKDKLTINGSVISYLKSYWNYGTGGNAKFIEREINYDPDLLYYPPPYFPTTGEYEFISWVEE